MTLRIPADTDRPSGCLVLIRPGGGPRRPGLHTT